MIFIIAAPMSVEETAEAIKTTVLSMNGTVKPISRSRLVARWKTNLKKAGVFDHSCTFYIGEGIIRAVTDYNDPEFITLEYRRLSRPLAFWNVFLEHLIKHYPNVDFEAKPGLPALDRVMFEGHGKKRVMVSHTEHTPSLSGAIVGGALFGTAGAIIGASSGGSRTTTTVRTTDSKVRCAVVRYSNGLCFNGKMINNSILYYKIVDEWECPAEGYYISPNTKPYVNTDSHADIDSHVDIDSMEGHQFEKFCGKLLLKNGYNDVVVTSASGDQGIDVIAYKESVKYGIQCKCYSADIGNKAVQEAYSGKTYYNCHVGVVLTNRNFTPSAVELAKRTGILLWGREHLLSLIKKAGIN